MTTGHCKCSGTWPVSQQEDLDGGHGSTWEHTVGREAGPGGLVLGVSMSRPLASDWMSPWKPTGASSNSNAPGRLSYLKRVLAAAVKGKTLHH